MDHRTPNLVAMPVVSVAAAAISGNKVKLHQFWIWVAVNVDVFFNFSEHVSMCF
jgi:hypothetical protein